MGKTLLILGAGPEQVPFIQKAKDMGLRTVVADYDRLAPGFKLADVCIPESTYDYRAIMDLLPPIDGVICAGVDCPMTKAIITHDYGLTGISIDTATIASDKLLMKDRFWDYGVPTAYGGPVRSGAAMDAAGGELGMPFVIKPADSRGARGVLRVTTDIDFDWAYNEAIKHSPTGRVLAEQWLEGPQISTESVVWDGRIITPSINDRNYDKIEELSPYIIENGGELPTAYPEHTDEIQSVIKQAVSALGVQRGTVKGDIVITDSGVKIIEMATRLSGGYYCTDLIPLSTGVDFVKAAIEISLGEKPDFNALEPKYNKHVAQRFGFPLGKQITSHPDRVGRATGMGETREDAIRMADRILHGHTIVNEGSL